MSYSFFCYGHPNITGKHKNTLEFTKENDLRLEGDCIIGVKADFQLNKIKETIKDKKEFKVTIKVDGISESINCLANHNFNDDHEIVLRKSNFNSERSLGMMADKACIDLPREFIGKLKNPNVKIEVILE